MHLLVPKELKVVKLFVDETVLLKSFGLLIFFAQNFAHCVVMTVGEIDLWFQMKTAADVCALYDIEKKQKP